MGKLGEILRHRDEIYPLLKVKLAAQKQIVTPNPKPHWAFCYSTLPKVSQSLPFLIQQLPLELRHIVCVLYLVLRALDTVEDDSSIPKDVKVAVLIDFHKHIFDPNGIFPIVFFTEGGTKEFAVLMDSFHHVSTALLELGKSYQEAIEDTTKRIGAGMAKFICKEVETVDDYDEYCHYAAGLVGCCLSRLFHISGFEDLAPDYLSNSMGLFLQKQSVIRDYWEDINEIPKPRMFWPRQIWSKYANKLEDLKYEEKSVKAVQCLNEMATNALVHVDDCFKYMSAIRDPAIFRLVAIPQVMGIVMLELCYNNIEVFRGLVKIRHGLTAKIFDRTRTMADVYRAFFDFADMMKSKVDMSDPNAEKTLSRLEAVQKTCMNSGMLHTRKSYIDGSWPSCNCALVVLVIIVLAIMLVSSGNRPTN